MLVLDAIGPEPEDGVWYGGLSFGAGATVFVGRSRNSDASRTLLAWDASTRGTRWITPVIDAPVEVVVARDGGWIATAYGPPARLWNQTDGSAIGALD
ncbi:MAG: hypothetical protein ACRELB_04220, partial [Polyangiaceae bacterium]